MPNKGPQLIFANANLPNEAAYYTFKENMRHGFSIEEIRELLELNDLDQEEIDSGYEKLLFTVREFIRSQLHEGIDLTDSERYLTDKGYSQEVIKAAEKQLPIKH